MLPSTRCRPRTSKCSAASTDWSRTGNLRHELNSAGKTRDVSVNPASFSLIWDQCQDTTRKTDLNFVSSKPQRTSDAGNSFCTSEHVARADRTVFHIMTCSVLSDARRVLMWCICGLQLETTHTAPIFILNKESLFYVFAVFACPYTEYVHIVSAPNNGSLK